MLLTLAVTLYTSRVVLNNLGVEDFGIYNVVGGVVTMMAFLSGAMSSATQRFFAFELGQNNLEQLAKVFKMSLNIHWLIVLVVILVAQTLGLWFVNTQLVIPPERLIASNWVFQCALFSFCCTVLGAPYNAAIIAHEKMSAFAYISIVDVLLKLTIVFLLATHTGDKLQFYALLLAAVSVLILGCYYAYARWQFTVARFSWYWNAELFKTLFSYTGWNLFGNLAVVMSNQGVNILLNLFFGAPVNAARAIAMQVNGAIGGFVNSLQMSINPQIIKSYAANDMLYMHTLVFAGARYSFYFLMFLSFPVFIESRAILEIWLGSVPEHADIFIKLVLIEACFICLSGTLMTSALATGKIKAYQAIVGGLQLLNIPLSFALLNIYSNPSPFVVYYVSIAVSIFALIARLVFLQRLINLSLVDFFMNVIIPSIKTMLTCILFMFVFSALVPLLNLAEPSEFFVKALISLIVACIAIFYVGLTDVERQYCTSVLKSKFVGILKG
ncbi:Polysaccharide biosynthesis protein [compost metagenome]